MQKTQLMPLAVNAPAYVTQLAASYGAPSQAGFGSAVFYQPLKPNEDLQAAALAIYQFFVGALWDRYGADAWLGPWQPVYTRPPVAFHNLVVELRTMQDREAVQSASLLLDNLDDPEKAHTVLAAAFDDPAVTELVVYKLGDGAAMGGILVAGRRQAPNEAIFLVFLID